MNTFSGFCIAACMFLIFVGMATGVVNTLGVFPSSPTIDTNTAQGTYNVGTYIWIGGTTATILLAIAIAITTKSTNLIALTAFGGVFWTSWGSIQSIFYTGGFLSNTTGIAIVLMLWFGMTVMFIGAIIGILSPGSTAMR